jgi:hypothetical protein
MTTDRLSDDFIKQMTVADNSIEIRTHYIKGDTYYLLFIAGLLSAFSIWMIILIKNIWFTLIFIWPALFLPFVILVLKSRKVIIGSDYVESVTLFSRKKMLIHDVKKFGVFVAGSYTRPKVTSQRSIDDVADEELLLHQIYLTENTEFDLDSFRTMKHLNFRYRREIYFRIKEMIERRDAQHTTKCIIKGGI